MASTLHALPGRLPPGGKTDDQRGGSEEPDPAGCEVSQAPPGGVAVGACLVLVQAQRPDDRVSTSGSLGRREARARTKGSPITDKPASWMLRSQSGASQRWLLLICQILLPRLGCP